jgi:hypothetical protein
VDVLEKSVLLLLGSELRSVGRPLYSVVTAATEMLLILSVYLYMKVE